MVVDDEEYITNSLSYMLEELDDPILEVSKAYSASEALKLMNNRAYDIVVTDIQMPGMSGIELLQKIHEKWPSCKVIFLTGYDDFNYACQALRYGAIGYILKAEGDEVLINAIRDCVKSIEKDEEHIRIAGQEENRGPQENFIRSLIAGNVPEEEELGRELADYGIGLRAAEPVMLLLGETDKAISHEMLAGIHQILIAKTGHALRTECIIVDRRVALWLLQPLEKENYEHAVAAVTGMAEQVQDVCDKSLHIRISFVFDPSRVRWEDLPRQYAHDRNLVNKYWHIDFDIAMATTNLFSGDSVLFFTADREKDEEPEENGFTNRIMLYINENLASDLSLTSLSEHFFLNPSYISRRFKELSGSNIMDVITKLRLDRAKQMLAGTNEKVGTIAETVGFESAAHFSRVFRKKEGMSPQDYRNKHQS